MVADRHERPLRVAEGDAVTLLERLRVVAASLRDFDHADDHIEVDTRDVSSLLTEAADAIEATTKERDEAEEQASIHASAGARLGGRFISANARAVLAAMERDEATDRANRLHAECIEYAGHIVAVEKERDDARAEVERLLRLATGPHINEEE